MRARAAVAAILISIFQVWIINPTKALPPVMPTATENAAPLVAKSVLIQDSACEVDLSALFRLALDSDPRGVWKSDKKTAFIIERFSKIFYFTRCKFQSFEIIMSEGAKISYRMVNDKGLQHNPAFYDCSFRSSYVREHIVNAIAYTADFSQHNFGTMCRDEFFAGKGNLAINSVALPIAHPYQSEGEKRHAQRKECVRIASKVLEPGLVVLAVSAAMFIFGLYIQGRYIAISGPRIWPLILSLAATVGIVLTWAGDWWAPFTCPIWGFR